MIWLFLSCLSTSSTATGPATLAACAGSVGEPLDSSATCDLCEGGCLQNVEPSSASHVEGDVIYEDPPPTGGDHNACWADWGVHTEAVPDENWVHNMEHGGVIFLYNCPDGCDAEVAELTNYVVSLGPTALLTPYAEMPYRFAATSWGWRLVLDCYDRDALHTFYNQHVDQAPESSTSYPAEGCM